MDAHLCSLVDTAIAREEEAYRFYTELLERVSEPAARDAIQWVAEEEVRHKAFLVRYRAGEFGAGALRLSEVVATRIAEHMAEPERSAQMIYSIMAFLVRLPDSIIFWMDSICPSILLLVSGSRRMASSMGSVF